MRIRTLLPLFALAVIAVPVSVLIHIPAIQARPILCAIPVIVPVTIHLLITIAVATFTLAGVNRHRR